MKSKVLCTYFGDVEYYSKADKNMYIFCFDPLCDHKQCFANTMVNMMSSSFTKTRICYDTENNTIYYGDRIGRLLSVSEAASEWEIVHNFGNHSELTYSIMDYSDFISSSTIRFSCMEYYAGNVVFRLYNSENNSTEWYGYNVKTKKLTNLSKEAKKVNDNYYIKGFYGGKLYLFVSPSGKDDIVDIPSGSDYMTEYKKYLYRCDIDFGNVEQTAVVVTDNCIYTEDGLYCYDSTNKKLSFIDLDSGEEIYSYTFDCLTAIYNISYGKAYYSKPEDVCIGTEYGNTVTNRNSKLYCLDIETGTETLVLDNPMCNIGGMFFDGDDIIVTGQFYKYLGDGKVEKIQKDLSYTRSNILYCRFVRGDGGMYEYAGFIKVPDDVSDYPDTLDSTESTAATAATQAATEATTAATVITEVTTATREIETPDAMPTENLWFSGSYFYNVGSRIINTIANAVEYYDYTDGQMHKYCCDEVCTYDCFAYNGARGWAYAPMSYMTADSAGNTLYYCDKNGCIYSVKRQTAEEKLLLNMREYYNTLSLSGVQIGKNDKINIGNLSEFEGKLIFSAEKSGSGKSVWLCYNMQTKDLVNLSYPLSKIYADCEIIGFYGGEIYFKSGGKAYKCDLNTDNIAITSFVPVSGGIHTDSGMYYYDNDDYKLYLRDYVTGSDKAIYSFGTSIKPFVMSDGKVYFVYSGCNTIIGKDKNGRDVKNYSGGKLYRLDIESGTVDCVIDDKMLYIYSAFVYGDKLIVSCQAYRKSDDGHIESYYNVVDRYSSVSMCYAEFAMNDSGTYENNGFIHKYGISD